MENRVRKSGQTPDGADIWLTDSQADDWEEWLRPPAVRETWPPVVERAVSARQAIWTQGLSDYLAKLLVEVAGYTEIVMPGCWFLYVPHQLEAPKPNYTSRNARFGDAVSNFSSARPQPRLPGAPL